MRIRNRWSGFALAGAFSLVTVVAAQQADVSYQYDALGRVTRATYGTGAVVTYTYDLAGNRLTSSSVPPPDAVNDTTSTPEDTAKTFDPRANDTDPGSLPLTITAKTNGTNGAVAILSSGTQLRYTPNGNFNGADSFTYTLSNGTATDTATVNVTVSAVDDAPNAVNDSLAVVGGTPSTFDPRTNDTEVDGQSLTVTAKTNGTKGVVAILSGGTQVRYTANAGATGADTFTYTVSDGALTDVGTVNVTINNAPNAVNDSISVTYGAPFTFNPRTNDTDLEGTTLTITAKTNGSKGTVTILSSGTQLRYTPNAGTYGADSFTYTVSDGALTDTATVTVNVPVQVVVQADGTMNSPWTKTSIAIPAGSPSAYIERFERTSPAETACEQDWGNFGGGTWTKPQLDALYHCGISSGGSNPNNGLLSGFHATGNQQEIIKAL